MLFEDWQVRYCYRWTFSPGVKLSPFFLLECSLDFHLLTDSSFTICIFLLKFTSFISGTPIPFTLYKQKMSTIHIWKKDLKVFKWCLEIWQKLLKALENMAKLVFKFLINVFQGVVSKYPSIRIFEGLVKRALWSSFLSV